MNILDLLTENEKKLIKMIKASKGEILFLEGAKCSSVGFVIKGEVEISSTTYEGKEIVYNTLRTNGIFGNNLLFSSQPYYKGNVISLTNSKIGIIDKNDLISLLQSNKEFLEKFLNYEADFGIQLNSKIKLLSLDSAEERLMHFLYQHNRWIYYKNVSSLARELNLQRETLSRLLTRLESEGKIARKKHHIGVISSD